MIRLGSSYLDQNKLRLVQGEKDFLLSQCRMELTDQADWDFQTDKPTQPEITGIEQMVRHTHCLSNNLDDIYT